MMALKESEKKLIPIETNGIKAKRRHRLPGKRINNKAQSTKHNQQSTINKAQSTKHNQRRSMEERDSEESTRTRASKFDFQLFLQQLRSKKADPVLRYIKSFMKNFTQRPFTVDEQVKIFDDFEEFIFARMAEYEPFSSMDEVSFENAKAGVEKLVMTKLFELTYSPAIPKSKLDESHMEDLRLDKILQDNYAKYPNLTAKDLDVDETLASQGHHFIDLAAGELNKMNQFKAPRAKIICLLNACKLLFQLIKSSEQYQNADEFLPLLVYTTWKAKVKHLYSDLHYLERFSFIKTSETQYYLVSLNAAAEYIRNLDQLHGKETSHLTLSNGL